MRTPSQLFLARIYWMKSKVGVQSMQHLCSSGLIARSACLSNGMEA